MLNIVGSNKNLYYSIKIAKTLNTVNTTFFVYIKMLNVNSMSLVKHEYLFK